jgi:hypothetical protein
MKNRNGGKFVKMGMKRLALLVLSSLMAFSACQRGEDYDYVYSPPPALADGIETAALESVGMRPGPLRAMMDRINGTADHRIHDILVLKNDRLVFEEYFPGFAFVWNQPGSDGAWMEYNRETDHFMASVSKSVTSVVAGCAVRQGLLPDLDRRVLDYYPEYGDILTGRKRDITLRHLITMTSGLDFDENTYPYTDPRNDIAQMLMADDPIRFVLAKPLTSAPGSLFFYNSGTTNVLAAIVAKAAGMGFLDFANQELFDPLNTQGGVWHACASGDTFASGGLFLRPRELAKIGLLFLNDGHWQGRELITPSWIADSQQERVAVRGFPADFGRAYGYLWWIREFRHEGTSRRCFFAAGWGDQYMFIIPSLDMIILFNCGNCQVNARISPFELVEEYILAAL